MSKLRKSDLKLIVKECLIEILAEGLVGNTAPTKNKKTNKNRKIIIVSLSMNKDHKLAAGKIKNTIIAVFAIFSDSNKFKARRKTKKEENIYKKTFINRAIDGEIGKIL